ncbi:MAG: nucleotidyltransferase domain-containing protein [Nocardioidaceae bacterium]|nr:nucleotidyltransferase domain-containing protein [Nocardioidaceae bacterium]
MPDDTLWRIPALHELRVRVRDDDNVGGLVLTGSHARGLAGVWSDVDVYVVVRERAGWETTRSEQIDLPVLSMADLADVPVDPTQWWNRYSFVDAHVLLDRTEGEIHRLVARWATLTPDEAQRCLSTYLDGYVNFVYRSLKAEREGRRFEQRLDAAESTSWMLWTVFALFGRVRPYNKYLRHELTVRPLDAEEWREADLPALLDDILDTGDASAQRTLYRLVESSARRHGHGPTIDAWGDELRLLRGD